MVVIIPSGGKSPIQAFVEALQGTYAKKAEEGTPLTQEEKDEFHIWSPFMIGIEDFSIDKMLLLLVAWKMMKAPDGMKYLKEIAVKYLGTVSEAIGELSKAGSTHPFSAGIHARLAARVFKNLGLLSPLEAADFDSWVNDMYNKEWTQRMFKEAAGVASVTFGALAKSLPAALIP